MEDALSPDTLTTEMDRQTTLEISETIGNGLLSSDGGGIIPVDHSHMPLQCSDMANKPSKQEQIARSKRIFDAIDDSGDGLLSVEELRHALLFSGIQMDNRQIFQEFNVYWDEELDFKKFSEWLVKRRQKGHSLITDRQLESFEKNMELYGKLQMVGQRLEIEQEREAEYLNSLPFYRKFKTQKDRINRSELVTGVKHGLQQGLHHLNHTIHQNINMEDSLSISDSVEKQDRINAQRFLDSSVDVFIYPPKYLLNGSDLKYSVRHIINERAEKRRERKLKEYDSQISEIEEEIEQFNKNPGPKGCFIYLICICKWMDLCAPFKPSVVMVMFLITFLLAVVAYLGSQVGVSGPKTFAALSALLFSTSLMAAITDTRFGDNLSRLSEEAQKFKIQNSILRKTVKKLEDKKEQLKNEIEFVYNEIDNVRGLVGQFKCLGTSLEDYYQLRKQVDIQNLITYLHQFYRITKKNVKFQYLNMFYDVTLTSPINKAPKTTTTNNNNKHTKKIRMDHSNKDIIDDDLGSDKENQHSRPNSIQRKIAHAASAERRRKDKFRKEDSVFDHMSSDDLNVTLSITDDPSLSASDDHFDQSTTTTTDKTTEPNSKSISLIRMNSFSAFKNVKNKMKDGVKGVLNKRESKKMLSPHKIMSKADYRRFRERLSDEERREFRARISESIDVDKFMDEVVKTAFDKSERDRGNNRVTKFGKDLNRGLRNVRHKLMNKLDLT